MPIEFLLNIRGKLIAVEARINDLPSVALEGGGNAPSVRINHLVIPGHNEVELYASHLPGHPDLSSEAQITTQVTKDGKEIYTHTWNADPAHPVLPSKLTGAFEAGEGFGPWQWQNAPVLSQALPQSSDLNALFAKMHRALSAKNVEGVLALLALKNAEMAKAFAMEADQMEATQRAFFQDLFRDPKWAMEPLHLEGAKHVFYAKHRVVHTLTHDDKEPLRTKSNSDGAIFSLPLLTAHLKNGWTIVR